MTQYHRLRAMGGTADDVDQNRVLPSPHRFLIIIKLMVVAKQVQRGMNQNVRRLFPQSHPHSLALPSDLWGADDNLSEIISRLATHIRPIVILVCIMSAGRKGDDVCGRGLSHEFSIEGGDCVIAGDQHLNAAAVRGLLRAEYVPNNISHPTL